MPPFTLSDLRPGDWIKYEKPNCGGIKQIAEIRSFYPFAVEPTADTSVGFIPLAWIVEVRRNAPSSLSEKGRMNVVRALRGADHECDRKGRSERIVDETGDKPITRIAPTCSVCRKPQVIG